MIYIYILRSGSEKPEQGKELGVNYVQNPLFVLHDAPLLGRRYFIFLLGDFVAYKSQHYEICADVEHILLLEFLVSPVTFW